MKIKKKPHQNKENHVISIIPLHTQQNNEKLIIPFQNHKNHEVRKITHQNHKNQKKNLHRIKKIIECLEFHSGIKKNIKTKLFHFRITKITKFQ